MSTVYTPAIPYGRIALILIVALIAAFFLEGEVLKIAIFVLAIAFGFLVADTERTIQRYRQKPVGLDFLRSVTYRHLDFFAGSDEEYRAFFASECCKPERIVQAASRDPKTRRIYSVAIPGRHHHVVSLMRQLGLGGRDDGRVEQGFVTSRGRFLGRREACKVAVLADQLIRKTPPEELLFSEDVWDPTVHSHQQLKDMADALIVAASGSEAVVTIELEQAFHQLRFMGNYRMVAHVRDSLPLIRRQDEKRKALATGK